MKNKKPFHTQGFIPFGNQGFWDSPNPWFGSGFKPMQDFTQFPFQGMFPGMNFPGFNFPGTMGEKTGDQTLQSQPPDSLWQQLGGLDGIITNMGKVQKILQMAQSISPYMKLFTQSIDGKPSVQRNMTKGRSNRKRNKKIR